MIPKSRAGSAATAHQSSGGLWPEWMQLRTGCLFLVSRALQTVSTTYSSAQYSGSSPRYLYDLPTRVNESLSVESSFISYEQVCTWTCKVFANCRTPWNQSAGSGFHRALVIGVRLISGHRDRLSDGTEHTRTRAATTKFPWRRIERKRLYCVGVDIVRVLAQVNPRSLRCGRCTA